MNRSANSDQPRRVRTVAALVTTLVALIVFGLVSACGSSNDNTGPTSTTFTSPEPVAGRWNNGNNGTSFEPCTSLTPTTLRALDVDPATWTDISIDGFGPRGCRATSATRTITLQVINTSAGTVLDPVAYVSTSSKHSRRPEFVFNRSTVCVATVISGDSTIMASVSDDSIRTEFATPYPKPGERLCPVAQDILNRTAQPIPAAAVHPTSTMDSRWAFVLTYPTLMQAGVLTERSAPGDKRVVVDSVGRLLPYSELIRSDPENSAGVTAAAELLAIQLRVPGSY